MSRIKKEEVRDGFFGDLPNKLQSQIMEIHKLVVDNCNSTIKEDNYSDIVNAPWAKQMLAEFLTPPKDKSVTGSVRVYKTGKRYRCMIQITGHVTNNRNNINEELFHDFIRNVHQDIKALVKRKYNLHLTCESEHGEPFEGFDIWTSKKDAEAIWNSFNDMKTKQIKEYNESVIIDREYLVADMLEMPKMLVEDALELASNVKDFNCYLELYRNTDKYSGTIYTNLESVDTDIDAFESSHPNMTVFGNNISLDNVFCEKLFTELDQSDDDIHPSWKCQAISPALDECVNSLISVNESVDENLSESEAKRTLATLSQSVINDCQKENHKVSQYTANIYANVITKNLLDKWSNGYRKFSITLDSYQSFNTLEFKTPAFTQDFISRLVDGKETINGLLHRNPEIKIKMSPRIFHTMKDKDDAFNFFKAAIKYYDSKVIVYADKIVKEVLRLNKEMKRLTQTTKLSGIVSMPLQMLFTFSDVDMSNKDTFTIEKEQIDAVNTFIKGIYSKYASPEKEKREILDSLQQVISKFQESVEEFHYGTLLDEVKRFYEGGYDDKLSLYHSQFVSDCIDHSWDHHSDATIRMLQESTKVKKLKKIPADLVAYISIEAECIKDANDKMMIASYCISKLELVEWYIELLETGSNRYLVPHTLSYLNSVRTQLLACYKKIMDVRIINPNDRPIIDIKYPDELKR